MRSAKRVPKEVSAANRLTVGDTVEPRELTTIRQERIDVPAANTVTHLQFRRFASCPICNVHLRSFVVRHAEIVAAGIQEVVVFYSTVEAMLPHQGELPFAAIADPELELYAAFGVEFSLRSVLDPRAFENPLRREPWRVALREWRSPGGRPMSIRGDSMLGHPADFLIAADGAVLAAKYGKHAADQWSVAELLAVARDVA